MNFRLLLLLALGAAGCTRGPQLPEYNLIHDFELTDQTGARFRASEKLKGHAWVANWIFTTCMGPCPRMSSQMRKIQLEAGTPEARFVSFTIDPARDSPPVLAEYAKRFQAKPDTWFFLTGSMADLNRLSKDVFMVGTTNGELEHTTRFALVGPDMKIRGYYDTSDPQSITQLVTDLKALAKS